MNNEENIKVKMKALQDAYAKELPKKAGKIDEIWGKLLYVQWDDTLFKNMHFLVHGIAGSGTAFGFTLISDIAKSFEIYLQPIIEADILPDAEQRIKISEFIMALKHASTEHDKNHVAEVSYEYSPAYRQGNNLICLVEDDKTLAENLALQINHFGYIVSTIQKPHELKRIVNESPPLAIIMDIVFPEGNLIGTEVVAEMQKDLKTPIPDIFISARNDMLARLHAVRAKGGAYLTKPLDISELIDEIDMFTRYKIFEPYRIMIVEDVPELAENYASILQHAGMITSVVTEPMNIIRPLVDFKPDLILMDVYMPQCSGLELASVIRQQKAYTGIPIVFLSTETDRYKQLSALNFGGDDFLTKPIQPNHLVSSVSIRAERHRLLRSFMSNDSLTGLLNHTATKKQLDIEVARAKRYNSSLSFAMIDIDHFKTVNDTYGHPAGDCVIKNLSRFLLQRLRETDIIGRYGGEEFGVILPNTDGNTALELLNEIQDTFSKVNHQHNYVDFNVTISCGIGCFSKYKNATALTVAADNALYQAKQQGRNKVVLA